MKKFFKFLLGRSEDDISQNYSFQGKLELRLKKTIIPEEYKNVDLDKEKKYFSQNIQIF